MKTYWALKQVVRIVTTRLATHRSTARTDNGEVSLVHCITVHDQLVVLLPDDGSCRTGPKPAQGPFFFMVPTTWQQPYWSLWHLSVSEGKCYFLWPSSSLHVSLFSYFECTVSCLKIFGMGIWTRQIEHCYSIQQHFAVTNIWFL
jgi:hypothetical protein